MNISFEERIKMNNLYYDEHLLKLKKRSETRDFRELSTIFFKHLPKSGLILDIGCGLGLQSKYLLSENYEVIGIEPCESLAKFAQEKYKKVVNGTFETLDEIQFISPPVGMWCAASLLHVPKDESQHCLHKMRKVIKKDGVLFITVRKGDNSSLDNYDNVKTEDKAARFIQLYDENFLSDLLVKSSFKINYLRIEDSYWGRSCKWISLIATAV